MLDSTFLHAQGIGAATEQSLWAQGATHWQAFLDQLSSWKITARHRESLTTTIQESQHRLKSHDRAWFSQNLPKKEHWRSISAFQKVGYLDIETDGGMGPDSLTLIGLSDGFETKIYVKGHDLHQFERDAEQFDTFVTFFGTGFDIPFLKRHFPRLERVFDQRFHIDLCPLLRRLGHRGGLKRIETQLGIARVPEAEGLSGMDAVRLWQVYQRGGPNAEEALRILRAYNREDVENMKLLLEYALPRLQELSGYNSVKNTTVKGAHNDAK